MSILKLTTTTAALDTYAWRIIPSRVFYPHRASLRAQFKNAAGSGIQEGAGSGIQEGAWYVCRGLCETY